MKKDKKVKELKKEVRRLNKRVRTIQKTQYGLRTAIKKLATETGIDVRSALFVGVAQSTKNLLPPTYLDDSQ